MKNIITILLLFYVCNYPIAQIPFNEEESNIYTESCSGRFYFAQNQWRGINRTYGFMYHNHSQNIGTGSVPTYDVLSDKGIPVTSSSTLQKIVFIQDRNNAEAVSFQVSFDVLRSDNSVENILIHDNVNFTTTATIDNFNDLNITLNPGDQIVWASRKVGGNTTIRYIYGSVTFEFEK